MATALSQTSPAQLSGRARTLLILPLIGSAFVGLILLLLPTLLAQLVGYSGNDLYIYWLTGAATIGYPIALTVGLRQNSWRAIRLLVVAFFTFGLASLYACFADILSGSAHSVVYVVLALTLLFVAITGSQLYSQRTNTAMQEAPVAKWVIWVLIVAIFLASIFGLVPLLFPTAFAHILALKGTDVFIYRQAGAATLGYAIMGVYELRSRRWSEMRLPVLMATAFNGISLIASIVALLQGQPPLLPLLVTPATLLITSSLLIALQRKGQ